MFRTKILALALAACALGACDQPMTTPQKGAVVGAGLIGGAVGYLGGTAIDRSR